jgi:lysophospholipase L1-like esterase
VTVWYGWNDWDDGMRGAHFREVLRFAVDRIRRMTGGKAEVLLLSSVPDLNSWNDRTELADAVRAVAEEKKTGLADAAAAFQAAGAAEDARSQLYAWDKVHLGEKGHQVTAETVLKAVAGGQ